MFPGREEDKEHEESLTGGRRGQGVYLDGHRWGQMSLICSVGWARLS